MFWDTDNERSHVSQIRSRNGVYETCSKQNGIDVKIKSSIVEGCVLLKHSINYMKIWEDKLKLSKEQFPIDSFTFAFVLIKTENEKQLYQHEM